VVDCGWEGRPDRHGRLFVMNILLVGKTPSVIADVIDQVDAPEVTFFSGSSLEDAVGALESAQIDHVILGGGLELDVRLQIVRSVFENSASTTVHMNSPSGPESYLPFVRSVLRGFDLGH
jgi:hypothetical protein